MAADDLAKPPDASKEPVLVIGSDPSRLETLKAELNSLRHSVDTATGSKEALVLAGKTRYALVVIDVRTGAGFDGPETVKRLAETNGPGIVIPIVAETDFGWMLVDPKAGEHTSQNWRKCVPCISRLRDSVNAALCVSSASPSCPTPIIGDSTVFKSMLKTAETLAPTDMTVLITGETGTGKEVVANLIYRKSMRPRNTFVAFNCSAMSEQIEDSELFGHTKGSFTGADDDRRGLLLTADGGTLFMDEIGDMSLSLQAKLLRTFQNGEVRQVGSDETKNVDVRFITATNKNLQVLVDQGTFRQDLFHRLNVLPVHVPPLRERGDDLELLSRHFVAQYAMKHDKPGMELNDCALDILRKYDWPGNVRELQAVLQRSVLLAPRGRNLDADDINLKEELSRQDAARKSMHRSFFPVSAGPLPDGLPASAEDWPLRENKKTSPLHTSLFTPVQGDRRSSGHLNAAHDGTSTAADMFKVAKAALAREELDTIMRQNYGQVTKAAKVLGISRRTLNRELIKHGLEHLKNETNKRAAEGQVLENQSQEPEEPDSQPTRNTNMRD